MGDPLESLGSEGMDCNIELHSCVFVGDYCGIWTEVGVSVVIRNGSTGRLVFCGNPCLF